MAWKRVRQEKDRCSVNKKGNVEVEEALESRQTRNHFYPCVLKKHTYMYSVQHTQLLLYLLSITSVWCWAIEEAIASSLMASVIEVHASFRRPLCYRFSHLSSISLTILLPCLRDSHLASPSLLLLIMYFNSPPTPFLETLFMIRVTVLPLATVVAFSDSFYTRPNNEKWSACTGVDWVCVVFKSGEVTAHYSKNRMRVTLSWHKLFTVIVTMLFFCVMLLKCISDIHSCLTCLSFTH